MATPKTALKPRAMPDVKPDLVARYECDGFRFPDRDYYDRHVVFDHVTGMEAASQREQFEAVARTLRDVLTQRWIRTTKHTTARTPSRSTICRWSSSSAGR